MPKRKPEEDLTLVTKVYCDKYTITKSKRFWDNLDKSVKKTKEWNNEVESMCDGLNNYFVETYGESRVVKAVPHSYKKLDENLNFEYVKPRNYLSFEGIKVSEGNSELVYYFGVYGNAVDTIDTIKEDLDAREQ